MYQIDSRLYDGVSQDYVSDGSVTGPGLGWSRYRGKAETEQ